MLFASSTWAADTVFTSTTAIKQEAVRLGDEALEVVKTPADIENHGLIGTLAVAGAVGLTYVFDANIRNKVQGIKGRTLDRAADVGSAIGNPFVHLGIAAAVYGGGALAGSPKWQETGEMLGEAALLADASGFLLKGAIGRGRPTVTSDKGSFRPFQFKSDYDSTPSLHTASSFAMASVMAATSESIPAKLFYYTAATFVGFSRIYQDKHWASDIVLGAALGELCGRVVTGYHARGGRLALVPAVSRDSAMLIVQSAW
jgi:membrane-associated phospholipid phosphatase